MTAQADFVARARDFAHCAHARQVDKAGHPYIEHIARVAAAVADDPEAEAVAWLHDVLEDCEFVDVRTLDAVFEPAIVESVETLTASLFTNRAYYYSAIRNNPLALRVKLADIADNADEARLALLDEKTADRLRRKYARARKALTGDTMMVDVRSSESPEQRIDRALESVLRAAGSSLRHYETRAKDDMREAMRKIMSESYIAGSDAVNDAVKGRNHD